MIAPAALPAEIRDMLGLDKPLSPEREAQAAKLTAEFQELKTEYEEHPLTVTKVPDHPIDLDAIEVILRMARSGTFGPAELRMRLRQVVG